MKNENKKNRKREERNLHKIPPHSLGVYSRFAFYAEGQVPAFALETAAKASVVPFRVHDEAINSKKSDRRV